MRERVLVLFDIDDTLIQKVGVFEHGMIRWQKALKQVYNININTTNHPDYNGWVDYQIGQELATRYGITPEIFNSKFGQLCDVLYQSALELESIYGKMYEAVPGVTNLIININKISNIEVGIMSGNLEKIGWWKLKQAGLRDYFKFGLFADDVERRVDIAKKIIKKAKDFFNIKYTSNQVFVIGDTVHDIECGQSIGAHTIAYCAQRPGAKEKLMAKGAHLVIDRMSDKKIIEFIKKPI